MGLEGLLSDFQHYLERYSIIAVAHDADVSHLEGRADIVRLPRVDAGLDLLLLLKALSERGG
jgi:hypothetical protein